jgi:hypothetical protein
VLAAAALAIALVPMALAYLQLGYHEDVRTVSSDDETLPDVERTLNRDLAAASDGLAVDSGWDERGAAVTTFRERLEPSLMALRRAGLDGGTTVQISYNDSRAGAWAADHCPTGPDREFGRCLTDRGVVVQERDGWTHVLAVAVDVSVTEPDATTRATVVATAPAGRRVSLRT